MLFRMMFPLWLAVLAFGAVAVGADAVSVAPGASSAPVQFGAAEMRRELAAHPGAGGLRFEVTLKGPAGVPAPKYTSAQSYALRRKGDVWYAIGADQAGAMYAALDLAELIRTGAIRSASDADSRPY